MTYAVTIALFIAASLYCYRVYGRWLSALADSKGNLPARIEWLRLLAAIGTPAAVVNCISLAVKIFIFLLTL